MVRRSSVISVLPLWSCSVLMATSRFSSSVCKKAKPCRYSQVRGLSLGPHSYAGRQQAHLAEEPLLGVPAVLLGQALVLLPHVSQDLGEVNARSSVHLHADLSTHLPTQGVHLLQEKRHIGVEPSYFHRDKFHITPVIHTQQLNLTDLLSLGITALPHVHLCDS